MHQLLDKLHNNLIGHGTLEEHSMNRNTLVVVCKVLNQREIFKVQLQPFALPCSLLKFVTSRTSGLVAHFKPIFKRLSDNACLRSLQ